jgi:dinuclear metal center YbgI/SA1388 family protein
MPGTMKPISFSSSRAITTALDLLLRTRAISDSSRNGLQVESKRPVRVVAGAVDASLAAFEAAAQAGADLLIVHHGIFWGEELTLDPPLLKRVRLLVDYGLSLYASHLPLDLHPKFGNNACLARALGLKTLQPFGEYHGQKIGWGGTLPQELTSEQLAAKLGRVLGKRPKVWKFGGKHHRLIRRVAVVSGGAGDLAPAAAAEGYDAFVSGEAGHSAYHPCREAGIQVFLGGHYATEVFGVKSVLNWVGKTYGVRTVFLDIPTGM